MKQKRIVTIQDISCLGKCSLTVALPIISAMGIEAVILPTAVLSTHTGGFQNFTFRDLTEDIEPIANHWQSLGLTFDAIYTGYLGSFSQLSLMEQFLDHFRTEDTLVVVDPVMWDHGRLYSGFTPEFPKAMARLCSKADLILPNLTEAAFLLGEEYQESYTEPEIRQLLLRLAELGARHVVLTGVNPDPERTGAMAYSSETGRFFSYFNEKIPSQFHGTGDIFASVCTGALTSGLSLEKTLTLAVDYTLACIQKTTEDADDRWYGVNFEACIPQLIAWLQHANNTQRSK